MRPSEWEEMLTEKESDSVDEGEGKTQEIYGRKYRQDLAINWWVKIGIQEKKRG